MGRIVLLMMTLGFLLTSFGVSLAQEGFSCFVRLGDPFFREVDVGPSGEPVLLVPYALAVA